MFHEKNYLMMSYFLSKCWEEVEEIDWLPKWGPLVLIAGFRAGLVGWNLGYHIVTFYKYEEIWEVTFTFMMSSSETKTLGVKLGNRR